MVLRWELGIDLLAGLCTGHAIMKEGYVSPQNDRNEIVEGGRRKKSKKQWTRKQRRAAQE
jgi:hypothetical protein